MARPNPEDKEKPEGDEAKEEDPVLTPSENALGIKIYYAKETTNDTMKRLYAVPSEKLRVWTCWLTKVGDRADDWQWWLRAQIRLTIRISNRLQKAALALEAEKNGNEDVSFDDEPELMENETSKSSKEIEEPELTPVQEALPKEGNVSREFENTGVPEGEPEETKQPGDPKEPNGGEEMGDKNVGKEGKGTETKGREPDPKIEYEEGFWPVGVRWKPVSQRTKLRPPPKRLPDDIPVPGNEEEMIELVRRIRHQGVVYRSLYKHWTDTADQAVKQMVGRPVLPTGRTFSNGEDVPYFFYLEAEEDVGYVIEHDDEEVLARDPDRERITKNFRHLYFNLSDKPGKGGKPWI